MKILTLCHLSLALFSFLFFTYFFAVEKICFMPEACSWKEGGCLLTWTFSPGPYGTHIPQEALSAKSGSLGYSGRGWLGDRKGLI